MRNHEDCKRHDDQPQYDPWIGVDIPVSIRACPLQGLADDARQQKLVKERLGGDRVTGGTTLAVGSEVMIGC